MTNAAAQELSPGRTCVLMAPGTVYEARVLNTACPVHNPASYQRSRRPIRKSAAATDRGQMTSFRHRSAHLGGCGCVWSSRPRRSSRTARSVRHSGEISDRDTSLMGSSVVRLSASGIGIILLSVPGWPRSSVSTVRRPA